MLHTCFGLAKATWPLVQENDKDIPFQKWGNPPNSPFTSGAECSKKLSDTEHITSGIEAFQAIIITKNRAGSVGSRMYRRPI